jgi:PAS domain S-box-containing protein
MKSVLENILPTNKQGDIESYLEIVQLQADKIVDKFIIGFFLFGLLLAPVYSTWTFSITTGSLTVILYLLARFVIQKKLYARMLISVVFAIFMLQFIGQMHGMAEIHFFFFTNIAILVIYQDWRIMAPYTILAIGHHSVLAFLQWYYQTEELGMYFISYAKINVLQLGFHFGLAGLMGLICGLSAYIFRQNSIKAYNSQLQIQQKNTALQAIEEELRQNLEELQATQEHLLKTQEEENKSNEIFKALFAHSSNAHLLFDETGIIDCNDATIKLLGYKSKNAILNLHPAKLSPEKQPDGRLSSEKSIEMDSIAQQKGMNRFEWIHQKADGTNFPVEVTLTPIKLSNKNILLVVWHDLTELKEKELRLEESNQELIASEEELKQNLEELSATQESLQKAFAKIDGQLKAINATIGYVELSIERKILQANPIFCDLVEYSTEEIKNLPHTKLVPIQQVENNTYEIFWQNLLQGNIQTKEYERITKSGKRIWIYASYAPIFDKQNNLVKIIKLAVDVTENKKRVEEIKMLSLVADKTSNAVIITDAEGRISWTNESFSKISGYTLAEVAGKKPGHFLQGRDTAVEHIQAIRKGLASKKSFTQEILNYHKNGTTYWLELNITPILDENGMIKQFFALETDITDRKQKEQEIAHKNIELQAASEEIRQNFEELHATQEQLKIQYNLMTIKNKNIADSMNYAKRIQDALLPRITDIQTIFPQSFVLFRPRDIISGDFYWFASKENLQIIVVADCTGHGVPGAFMSMLGSSLLNQIIHDKEIHTPSVILDVLHIGVVEMLNQRHAQNENRDGMDAVVCVIDKQNNLLHFAGANNPLYLVSKNNINFSTNNPELTHKITENNGYLLTELKGDKKPIGGRMAKQYDTPYHLHTLAIDQLLKIYLFSDGFIDQIGGENGRKLMSKGFKQLILDTHWQDVAQQKESYEQFFVNWIGANNKQLDDVVLLGMEIAPTK